MDKFVTITLISGAVGMLAGYLTNKYYYDIRFWFKRVLSKDREPIAVILTVTDVEGRVHTRRFDKELLDDGDLISNHVAPWLDAMRATCKLREEPVDIQWVYE